jgi:hypothetical protein
MSRQEQLQLQGNQASHDAKADEAFDPPRVLRVAAKILAILFALTLLPLWFYLCSAVEVTLDYPVRLAGIDSRYPARGTFDFWWGCLVEASQASFFSYLFGGIPIIAAISFCFCYGLSIRNSVTRVFIVLVIASGPFIYAYMYIRFYSKLDAVWDFLRKFQEM